MSLDELPKPFIDEPITYKPQSAIHDKHLQFTLLQCLLTMSWLNPAQTAVIFSCHLEQPDTRLSLSLSLVFFCY